MLFNFLHKKKDISEKKDLIITMIKSLNIPNNNKKLYLEALNISKNKDIFILYENLVSFIEKIEILEIEKINKENFSIINGMRKKEAKEQIQEMNSFSFLLHNL